ncbi:MAG: CoA transferase [Acidimicrobiales bacterium]
MRPFHALEVVEVAGSIAGAYCGKLFADHGATVTLVGPSALSEAEAGYLHQGKATAPDLDPALLARADVVIESTADRPLEPLTGLSDTVVRVQVSPFGSTGPYASWRSSDLIDYALSGHQYLYGDPEREPLRGPPNQPRYASALFAFIGAMVALLERERSGSGQTVEVDHLATMAVLHQFTLLRYTIGGDVLRRMGNRFTGQGHPNGIFPCADGWVSIAAPASDQIERLLGVSGLDHLLERPDISSPMDFQTSPHVLDEALLPWLAAQPVADVVELLQAVRVPAAPTTTMERLLDDPQLAARHYWTTTDDGHRVPGRPFRLSGHPWRATGARTDRSDPGWLHSTPSDDRSEAGPDAGPLAGLRVLDLARVWAGPLAARLLAELGADVIWVEAPWSRGPRLIPESVVRTVRYYPDDDAGACPWNRSGHLVKYSIGKRSSAIDLGTGAGVAAFERLVPWADVVLENYSPRVMPQFGLGEERLHELNPGLVYVTMPGYGRSGPAEQWLAYGSSVDSHAGLSHLIGYPDQVPWKGGIAWPDPIAGLHAVGALLIALWDRGADGGGGLGQTVEVAQFEATTAVVGDQLLAAQLAASPRHDEPMVAPPPASERPASGGDPGGNGGPGNRDALLAPQGTYRCRGDDRWLSLSVLDDEGWRALCHLAGLPAEWAAWTVTDRRDHHDRIDHRLGRWTAYLDQVETAELLQEHGVAAGAVHDAAGVRNDRHLLARGAFVTIDQPEFGPFVTPALPPRLSRTPTRIRGRAPLLGEHNRQVLADLGGLDEEEITALESAGVIADRPPG